MLITTTSIIFAFIGLALGAVITGLIFHSKSSTIKANLDNANRQLEETKKQAEADLKEAKDDFDNRFNDLKKALKDNYDEALKAKDQWNSP